MKLVEMVILSHTRGSLVRTEGNSLRSARQGQTVSKVLWGRECVQLCIHVATPAKLSEGQ